MILKLFITGFIVLSIVKLFMKLSTDSFLGNALRVDGYCKFLFSLVFVCFVGVIMLVWIA